MKRVVYSCGFIYQDINTKGTDSAELEKAVKKKNFTISKVRAKISGSHSSNFSGEEKEWPFILIAQKGPVINDEWILCIGVFFFTCKREAFGTLLVLRYTVYITTM